MPSLSPRLFAGVSVSAVLALVLVGGALAQDPAPVAEDPVVARVNGQDILQSEVVASIELLPPQYRQLPLEMLIPAMAEQVAMSRLMVQEGEAAGLGDDPDVVRRVAFARDRIIQEAWLKRQIEERITDDMVEGAYQQYLIDNPQVEEVHARHILVDTEEKATELIVSIAGGADFVTVANENTNDPSGRGSGGDLGFFQKGQMVPEFADAAFAMEPGQVSETPVQTQFGWHIIKVEEKRLTPQPTKADLESQLRDQLGEEVVGAIVEEIRTGATIELIGPDGNPIPASEPPAEAAPQAAPDVAPETAPAEGQAN